MKSRGTVIKFHDVDGNMPPEGNRILVLGSSGPQSWSNYDYQYTLSLKQIESRANAGTVMFAALDLYFNQVQGLPDDHTVQWWYTGLGLEMAMEEDFDFTEPIAVDVETGGVLGENVTPWSAPMITIAFAQGGKAHVGVLYDSYLSKDDYEGIILALQKILPKIEKPIFHNGKFDIAVIESNTGIRMPNWFDTMLAHHVLNMAAREHGLKIVCNRYFDAPDWDSDIGTFLKGGPKDYSRIPPEFLAKYNGYDVLWTYRLWEMLQIQIDSDEYAQTAFYLEMQAADFLYDVEKNGIPFSLKEANKLKQHYVAETGAALDKLRKMVDEETFNPSSHVQVKQMFERKFMIKLASTNKESLDAVITNLPASPGAEFAQMILEYRSALKMITTYIRPWEAASQIEGDSRVHPTFMVHGTTTGRLASSDPNAQNVPRDKMIRKMVTLDGTNELV